MRNLRHGLRALALTVVLTAPVGARAEGPILVMGDSVMAWNGLSEQSVGHALESRLGRPVERAAVPGAQVGRRGIFGFALGIGSQFRPGDWSWVVLNGGANDLMGDCGCRRCDAVLDRLLAADGRRGQIASLAARLRASGAQVLYIGYYGPSGRGGDFDPCADELAELDRRVARMARIVPGIAFVDAGDVMSSAAPRDYAADNVHPSPRGSAKIAALAAEAIRAAEAR